MLFFSHFYVNQGLIVHQKGEKSLQFGINFLHLFFSFLEWWKEYLKSQDAESFQLLRENRKLKPISVDRTQSK